jgi:hypothetical protein
MEDSMCWEIDYKFLAEQEKAPEKRIKQQRRADVIGQLLNEADQQAETAVGGTPVEEVASAK